MKYTIAYITNRTICHFDWFCDALMRENPKWEDFDVVVIDSKLWYDEQPRREYIANCVKGRFPYKHFPPKPSVWQGPTRRTKKDHFCPASARNTAFICGEGDHFIFIDDLSVPMPGWLSRHMYAGEKGFILAGLTNKTNNIKVDNGLPIYWDKNDKGLDSRVFQFKHQVECNPGWLFGGNFSVPLAGALRVNGQDEICNSVGGEDYIFGIALTHAGYTIKVDHMCLVLESDDEHNQPDCHMAREGKLMPDGEEDGIYILRRYREEQRTFTISDHYNLREAREHYKKTCEFINVQAPEHDWRDSKPLSEV
jgi:hypothetical protein